MHEQTEKYETEKFMLNQKLEVCEHKIKEYQSNLSAIENTKLAKYENEAKVLISKLQAKDDEINKYQCEIKQLKNDLIGKNIIDDFALKEQFSKLFNSLSLNNLFMLLSQFFLQIELRYNNKIMENKQFEKFSEINQKNRLTLQDFSDKYLLYSSADINDKDFSVTFENLCESLDLYSSILNELTENLICK